MSIRTFVYVFVFKCMCLFLPASLVSVPCCDGEEKNAATADIYIASLLLVYLIFWHLDFVNVVILHTCIYLHILAYLRTCILAYLHTCILVYLHTCILAYLHTCILAHLYSSILESSQTSVS